MINSGATYCLSIVSFHRSNSQSLKATRSIILLTLFSVDHWHLRFSCRLISKWCIAVIGCTNNILGPEKRIISRILSRIAGLLQWTLQFEQKVFVSINGQLSLRSFAYTSTFSQSAHIADLVWCFFRQYISIIWVTTSFSYSLLLFIFSFFIVFPTVSNDFLWIFHLNRANSHISYHNFAPV